MYCRKKKKFLVLSGKLEIMNEKIRIVFVYTCLGEGGISTSLMALLHELSSDERLDITLCLLNRDNTSRFVLPESININYPSKILDLWYKDKQKCKGLNLFNWYLLHFIGIKISMKPIELLSMIKKQKTYYDIAVSYVNDINKPKYINMFCNDFVLKCLNAKQKWSWTHNDPYRLGYTSEYIKKRYKDFDKIVNVSFACKKKFDTIYPDYTNKSFVVHNCVYEIKNNENVSDYLKKNDDKLRIVSVCRLDNKQKRIDRAIDVCKLLIEKGYIEKFEWDIYGSGSDEKYLKNYAIEKSVENKLLFKGTTKEPLEKMKNADVFVMTSDYEACGLTLLESLSVGTPVIVTDFPEARESVSDMKNGFIVDITTDAIADKLIQVIEDRTLLQQLRTYIKNNPVSNKQSLIEFYNLLEDSVLK